MIEDNFYVNELEMIDPDMFTRKIDDSVAMKCLEKMSSSILKKINERKI